MTQIHGSVESSGAPTLPAGRVSHASESRRATALWGLSTRQLHDAYWASRGVQCVRRGESQRLERAAELYLLIDPEQLVSFNLSSLRERLTWNNAAVMRLRLVEKRESQYSERVVTNADGCVDRIERCYGSRGFVSFRVMLTPSKRLAAIWMNAPSRRVGWDLLRRSVNWLRVDHLRTAGVVYEEGERDQEIRFLDHLVERWPQPGQVIDGIKEIEPDVWTVKGETVTGDCTRVGPLWFGLGAANDRRPCLVGPGWEHDRLAHSSLASGHVRVRPIAEVEPIDTADPVAVPRQSVIYPLAKRAFDIVFSLGVLIGFAPVFAVVAMLIVMEDGRPILFGHTRQGRGGRFFRCWKFRTMVRNAEEIADELGEYNICDGPQVYIQNDPRVTRIGRVLRNLQLDEMPQFWNVLIGQMSVVGPRPSPIDENVFCPAWRDARLSVRPGITGLWQLMRTREPGEDFREWIKYDLRYVKKASFILDLKIIARTAWAVIGGRRGRAID
jgi:lipopolysaccharide/colanic/teichoic acid biosynthesis glycosyltransferase